MKPLYIAFLWHMHQPYYKDLLTNHASMPWARMHGIKDYLDMVEILDEFPAVHQTFNFVPSLIEQLQDYQDDKVLDKYLELSKKKAADLSEEEKGFILTNFFMANWEKMARPHHRYYDLLIKRGKYISPAQLISIQKKFSGQDMLDLQVWFNLCWFDPSFKQRIPGLKSLVEKGQDFTEEDKLILLHIQKEILQKILPTYKKFQEKGQIEITTSPYYHPILPLLCDTDIAKEALPELTLPDKRFKFPEDAKWQIEEALKFYRASFGCEVEGMWPSEGSLSEEVISLFMDAGIGWAATDEAILFRSIKRPRAPEFLYKPYLVERDGRELAIIFRDRNLSDAISFKYANVGAEEAVGDLLAHLHNIRQALKGKPGPHLVSIIMDGENAWEYYPNDGRDFLQNLYRRLSDDRSLKVVTVSEFLQSHPPKDRLSKIPAGSWINGNFAIWIGDKEKNAAWDYLSSAREDLVNFEKAHPEEKCSERLSQAWREIYIAEGSDWNWWYGFDHTSSNDEEFDRVYRLHLSNVYNILELPVPEHLKRPIRVEKTRPVHEPVRFLSPVIDGRDTNYYEWLHAGFFDVKRSGGTMHTSEGVIDRIYYGFDLENLYLRLDLKPPSAEEDRLGLTMAITFAHGYKLTVPIFVGEGLKGDFFKKGDEEAWLKVMELGEGGLAYDKVLELVVGLESLGVKSGDELEFSISVEKEGAVLEIAPEHGLISIAVPPPDFEAHIWSA